MYEHYILMHYPLTKKRKKNTSHFYLYYTMLLQLYYQTNNTFPLIILTGNAGLVMKNLNSKVLTSFSTIGEMETNNFFFLI